MRCSRPCGGNERVARGSHVARSPRDAVELRGRYVLFGLVAAVAGAGVLAYGWRATHGGSWLSWAIAGVLAVVTAVHLWGWQDARTPRLVADAQGIRFRRGGTWAGTPWEQLSTIDVTPDRGRLRGGQLVIRSGDEKPMVRFDLPPRGAADVAEALRALGAPLAPPVALPAPTSVDVAEEEAPPASPQRRASLTPVPAASPRRAVRADVRRGVPESVSMLALRQPDPASLPEAKELRGTQGRVGLVLETTASPTPPVLAGLPETAVDAAPVDPYPTRPAASPVIGPELAGARQRFGLSVDSLADRTRIRPHVIESIEVDDFEPCGGDFYARGHIRSLARVLGVDSGPLLGAFEELYASAPIDARRVFEAELATGTQPMIRLSSGGPNWVGLLGMVVVLAIVWGVATMLTRDTSEANSPAGQRAGIGAEPSATTPDPDRFAQLGKPPEVNRVRLLADGGDSIVTVRDSDRNLIWRGVLSAGESRTVRASGPLTVLARDGGVVTVSVNGRGRGLLGALGTPARRVLGGAERR